MLQAIVSGHRAAWLKFSPSEEIAHLLKWSAVLQGETAQAGDHVVEGDNFAAAVGSFDPEEEFRRLGCVMNADVKRPLPGDFDFVCDVISASRKKTADRGLSYIGHGFCNSL